MMPSDPDPYMKLQTLLTQHLPKDLFKLVLDYWRERITPSKIAVWLEGCIKHPLSLNANLSSCLLTLPQLTMAFRHFFPKQMDRPKEKRCFGNKDFLAETSKLFGIPEKELKPIHVTVTASKWTRRSKFGYYFLALYYEFEGESKSKTESLGKLAKFCFLAARTEHVNAQKLMVGLMWIGILIAIPADSPLKNVIIDLVTKAADEPYPSLMLEPKFVCIKTWTNLSLSPDLFVKKTSLNLWKELKTYTQQSIFTNLEDRWLDIYMGLYELCDITKIERFTILRQARQHLIHVVNVESWWSCVPLENCI